MSSSSKCIIDLCKNISYNLKNVKSNNNSNFYLKNVYDLLSDYNHNDWEKYISNKTTLNNLLYRDEYIGVYLNKWFRYHKIYSFNETKPESFIKVLNGSLKKTSFVKDKKTDVKDKSTNSIDYENIDRETINREIEFLKNGDVLYLDSRKLYSIDNIVNNIDVVNNIDLVNNIQNSNVKSGNVQNSNYLNKNYPVSLHIYNYRFMYSGK